MGWEMGGSGFRIVLAASVADVVRAHLGDDVEAFLDDHDLKIRDVDTWVAHPGGPKVIDAIVDALRLAPGALGRPRPPPAPRGARPPPPQPRADRQPVVVVGPGRARTDPRRRSAGPWNPRGPHGHGAGVLRGPRAAGMVIVNSVRWYTLLVVLVGLIRLVELSVAQRNLRWARDRGGVETGAGHYPVMVALHSALLVGCLVEVWVADRPFLPWLGWPMLALLVAAHALRWW